MCPNKSCEDFERSQEPLRIYGSYGNGNTANGTRTLLSRLVTVPSGWIKVTSTNQLWRFLHPLEDSTQCIVLRSHHNRWLCAENDAKTVSNNRMEIKRWEKFEIIFTKDGFVNLKTWKNKYLSAQRNGQLEANRDAANGWEKFEMFISGDTKVGFRSTHGKWLSAQPDGRMEVNRDVLNIWEMFHGWKEGPASNWKPVAVKVTVPSGWEKVTNTNKLWRFLHPLEDSTQCIVLRSHHNRWLCAENDAKTVSNNRMEINRWEKFEIIFTKDGFVNLKTWKNKYLSAQRNGQLEANRDAANGWEKFEMFISGDAKVGFRSTHGKWLSAQPDGRMEVNRDVLNRWEMFHGWKEGPASNWEPVSVKLTVPAGWVKVTSTNQLWRFLDPLEDSTQCIVLRSHHNRWLSAENDTKTISNDRREIKRWEKFEIIFTKDGFVNLKTWKNKYLSAQPNGQLEANRDSAKGWEKFEMFISGDTKVGFRSTHGKWLSAQPDGRMEVNRDVLNIWEMFHGWKTGPASNWKPVSVNPTVPSGWEKVTNMSKLWRFLNPLEDSTQCIVLRSHHNKWLCAENDAKTISNNRVEIKRWEKFEIIFTKDGLVNLKTWKNKYLSAQSNGKLEANRDVARGWESFEMLISGDTKVAFRSTHGKWLSAQPDGQMEANRDVLNIWEMFHGWKEGSASNWKPVSLTSDVPEGWNKVSSKRQLGRFMIGLSGPASDGDDYIVLKSHHGKWLCAEEDAFTITNSRTEPKRWEKFDIVFVEDGIVALRTWKGKFLSARPNGTLEANREWLRGDEKFHMFIYKDEKVAFRSERGKWLSAQPDGRMEFNRDKLSIWETFYGLK